ncbi:MAG: hypothetical protein AUG08_10755 [Acidobacteria bacterium 13_1_20CM_2_55_15]|nr:MAG: hypothetical protein AUG08_10755 [Acidobacteria bacterium 13_1_20CM_2_55_15]PYR68984.1 MAG: hypothetical protein DMG20_08335 [Acidobacteriota bacterium]
MARLKIGDQVRVLGNTARKGEVGTIIDIVLCASSEDRFQSYIVEFDTPKGRVSEHYRHYELYIPLTMKQCTMTSN